MSPQHTPVRFGAECIRLDATAGTWQDAVQQAADVLEAIGAVGTGYAGRMIRVIENFGPYVVVAPGVALVHARPDVDVRQNAASLVTFPDGVRFGHPENDPVRVVVGLAVTRPEDHVKIVAVLAKSVDREGAVGWMLAQRDPHALAEAIIGLVQPLNVIDAKGDSARRLAS